MKKILSLLLVTLLVFTLFSGCSSDSSKTADKKSKTDKESLEVEEIDKKDVLDVEKPDEDDTLEIETSDEDGNAEKEISRGIIKGNVYKNNYLGFEFTKPKSWVYSTDEEIAAVMNIAVDQFLGDEYEEFLENNIAIYDMMVVDSITRTNINISYENLEKTLSSNITEEQYINAVKEQLAGVPGMTVTFSDKNEKVYLGKSNFTRCICESSVADTTYTQVFYLRKIDGYMVSVIVTIMDGYTVEEIEDMFQ